MIYLMDLTSNFFNLMIYTQIVPTWKFIYINIHSGWSLAWIFMKQRVNLQHSSNKHVFSSRVEISVNPDVYKKDKSRFSRTLRVNYSFYLFTEKLDNSNAEWSKYTQRQWKVTSIEISIFRKIYNTALWILLPSYF